jgi:hypothetical protein
VVREEPKDNNTRERARMSAVDTRGLTRMVLRKNQTWERYSIARAAYDPEHIHDCNFKATVGKHFQFHEPIPRSENGQVYLDDDVFYLFLQKLSNQIFAVVASERVFQCMDVRGTLDVRGKRIQMVCKQHYIESPPVDVARIFP